MALTKVFRSTHTGAPTLAGNTADALQTLLDALLVIGFNSKTVTITRSGSTATANCTSHGFTTGQVVKHSGADQAEYNVEARITVVDANNYTFALSGTPATPATGTITAKVAPLGWSTAFSSGTDRSYQRPGASRGFYLNVSNGAATNLQRVRLFETVTAAGSAIANGTNPTPSDTAVSGGGYFYSSQTTDATTRAWHAWGDDKAFFLLAYTDATNYHSHLYVGDAQGGHATYGVAIWTGVTNGATNGMMTAGPSAQSTATSFPAASPYILRNLSGSGTSERLGVLAGLSNNVTLGADASGPAYGTFGLIMSRCWLQQAARGVFGYLPGLWAPTGNRPITKGDTFSGAAGSSLSAKTFECLSGASHAQVFAETSDNW